MRIYELRMTLLTTRHALSVHVLSRRVRQANIFSLHWQVFKTNCDLCEVVLKDDVFFGVAVYCYDAVHSCVSWKERQNYSFLFSFLTPFCERFSSPQIGFSVPCTRVFSCHFSALKCLYLSDNFIVGTFVSLTWRLLRWHANYPLAAVGQRLDTAIHWINYNLHDKSMAFRNSCPTDSDLLCFLSTIYCQVTYQCFIYISLAEELECENTTNQGHK